MSMRMVIPQVEDVRDQLVEIYLDENFVIDKSGCKLVEVLAAQFIANEPSIFGKINEGYVKRELEWYMSMSLNVNTIPPPVPKAWLDVADNQGFINSNYGYLVFSPANHMQFKHVIEELESNSDSRRAMMVYNRPSIWNDYKASGKNDFICCTSVQYLIRENVLYTIVNFRSNDVFAGYRNDKAFQDFVTDKVHDRLVVKYPDLRIGDMIWNASSLHVYERDFYLLQHYYETGEWNITKAYYEELKS